LQSGNNPADDFASQDTYEQRVRNDQRIFTELGRIPIYYNDDRVYNAILHFYPLNQEAARSVDIRQYLADYIKAMFAPGGPQTRIERVKVYYEKATMVTDFQHRDPLKNDRLPKNIYPMIHIRLITVRKHTPPLPGQNPLAPTAFIDENMAPEDVQDRVEETERLRQTLEQQRQQQAKQQTPENPNGKTDLASLFRPGEDPAELVKLGRKRKRHTLSNKPGVELKCQHCEFTSLYRNNLNRHTKDAHPDTLNQVISDGSTS
jgi:hypothetical protein